MSKDKRAPATPGLLQKLANLTVPGHPDRITALAHKRRMSLMENTAKKVGQCLAMCIHRRIEQMARDNDLPVDAIARRAQTVIVDSPDAWPRYELRLDGVAVWRVHAEYVAGTTAGCRYNIIETELT